MWTTTGRPEDVAALVTWWPAGQEQVMTVRNRYERNLQLIESSLLGSDPQLASMLNVFSRLTAGQGMPIWEQLPSRRDCLREAVALIQRALALAVAALVLMFWGLADIGFTVTGRPSARTRLFSTYKDTPGPIHLVCADGEIDDKCGRLSVRIRI